MEILHLIVIVCIALSCGIGTGVLIGWFSGPERVPDVYEYSRREADSGVSTQLINEMKADNVRDFLWELTQNPHVAGTQQNKDLADQIHGNWTEYGFQSSMHSYKVLLSFPSKEAGEDNKVEILNGDGSVNFTSQLKEKPLDNHSKEKEDLVLPPFNAYSAQGVITNDLVYVNYARVEDFQFLEEKGINLTGKIAIARYGVIFRGDKAKFAVQAGVAGLILYSDPKDYAIPGGQTYPDGYFLPGTGVQRGTCMFANGDPETPGYPSVEQYSL
ncbi:glutamate carboxypeptidase 2-like [Lytechinus variegatus]|uniref:glutamate carboxypeptidase 2-like n=1 Tax=Lytechinus variegatus TaxID=7654 RepID=UPI001BB0F9B5|nr:glutamate carboxypeptidase 2-like [Lytechinus variegatus]